MSNLFEFIKFSLAFVQIKNVLRCVQLGGGGSSVKSPEGSQEMTCMQHVHTKSYSQDTMIPDCF